ncbi:MAG: TonB-dependent receptor [Gammaproteobacteria bacterium]|nr:TonB-dependent receptor [Gammaproteobacteria bacterium]
MRKISTLALAIASCLSAHTAMAQTQNAENIQTAEKKVERIEITGSRIKGVDLEGTQPLVVITADDIKNSGASNLYELLKDVGQLRGGSGTFSPSESGAGSNDTPAGQAAASLRGLGPSSTLTLVNGRRVAASSFAAGTENFVDINSIPVAAIERIEILATGASAIYGADAVAGVINYVLKKDFDGAEINVNYGNSTASSDEGKTGFNLIWGTSDDNSSLTAFLDLYDRKDFAYSDRTQTAETWSLSTRGQYASVRYTTSDYKDPTSGEYVGFADPACPAELKIVTDPAYGDTACGYNPNKDMLLNPALKSVSGGLMYSLNTGNVRWFNELFVSQTESMAQSTPANFTNLQDQSNWLYAAYNNPFIQDNDELASLIYPIRTTSPNGQTRVQVAEIRGRFLAPRRIDNTTTAYRFVSGLQGEVGDFEWETAVTYSRSESEQTAVSGIYNRYKFNAALFGELCSNGDTNCSPSTGGLWFNPFGGQSGNEQVLALIGESPRREGKSEVLGIDLRLNGDLFELPAGTVASAFGAEFRQEKLTDTPDLIAQSRFDRDYLVDVIGFGSSKAKADRDQAAVFAELFVPLTTELDLQLAGRFDKYDDFGSSFNPKIGLTWRPTDNLVFRGSAATSFRAPSLTQGGVELRTTSTTARCLPEFAAIYCGGDIGGEITPNTLEFGNKDLQAEEAKSISAGFAWSLTETATFTADYWQFDHEKTIGTDLESTLLKTLNDPTLRFCGLVPADKVGISYTQQMCTALGLESGFTQPLDQVLANWQQVDSRARSLPLFRDHILLLENTGNQQTKGIDFTYSQSIDSSVGRFRVTADVTKLMSFSRERGAFSSTEQLAGSFRYPKILAGLKLKWDGDQWFSGLAVNYTSDYQDEIALLDPADIDRLAEQGVDIDRRIPAWSKVNANLGYEFNKHLTVTLNIDNLLDRDPPFVYGRYKDVDLLNHDVLGRNYRLQASYKF